MSQQVIGLIHWQAVKLAMKRVPFHHKPPLRPRRGIGAPRRGPTRRRARAGAARAAARMPPGAAAPRSDARLGAARSRSGALAAAPRGATDLGAVLPDGTRAARRRPRDRARSSTVTVRVDGTSGGGSPPAGAWRWASRTPPATGDADDLVGLLEILALTAEEARRRRPAAALTGAAAHRPRLPARAGLPGARRDIDYHYDLGNDLYALFLDPSWTYSCALFERPEMTLQEAQEAKYRRICEKLGLGPGAHVLEIGCGWGGFALHAAGEWGARVTGADPAPASRRRSRASASRPPASPTASRSACRTTARSRAASATSPRSRCSRRSATAELPVFFGACDRLLAPDGIACIQTIAVPDQRYERYRRGNDWIREYIFPGAPDPVAARRSAAR